MYSYHPDATDGASDPGELLVEARDLERELGGAAGPVLLDARWRLGQPDVGREEYLRGHLPGAAHLDVDRDLAGIPGPRGRHPLPDGPILQLGLRRCGVNEGDAVVVYDGGDGFAAARAWWTLRWAGLTRVRILNGGLRVWLDAGLPVSPGAVDRAAGNVVVRPGGMPTVDASGALATARDGVLLDARAAERFRGEVEPVDAVAGRIPGARSAPTTENLAPSGRFRSPHELSERFRRLGMTGSPMPVAVYCGSGVTAAHEIVALELAGVRGAALYPGSWSEWITDPRRPVARGPESRDGLVEEPEPAPEPPA